MATILSGAISDRWRLEPVTSKVLSVPHRRRAAPHIISDVRSTSRPSQSVSRKNRVPMDWLKTKDTIRYDTRSYFNVRSNGLPHGTKLKKWKREKLKSKKTDMLRSIGKQFRGIRRVSPAEDRKGRLRWEGFGWKECFKPGIKEWGVMNDKSGESIQPMEEVPRKEGKMPDIREKCRKK